MHTGAACTLIDVNFTVAASVAGSTRTLVPIDQILREGRRERGREGGRERERREGRREREEGGGGGGREGGGKEGGREEGGREREMKMSK